MVKLIHFKQGETRNRVERLLASIISVSILLLMIILLGIKGILFIDPIRLIIVGVMVVVALAYITYARKKSLKEYNNYIEIIKSLNVNDNGLTIGEKTCEIQCGILTYMIDYRRNRPIIKYRFENRGETRDNKINFDSLRGPYLFQTIKLLGDPSAKRYYLFYRGPALMIDSEDTRFFAIFMDRVKPVLDKDTVSLETDEGDKAVLKITGYNPLSIHISYLKKTSKKLRLLFSMPTTKPITLAELDKTTEKTIKWEYTELKEPIIMILPSKTGVIENSLLDLRDFPIKTVGEEYEKGFLLGFNGLRFILEMVFDKGKISDEIKLS